MFFSNNSNKNSNKRRMLKFLGLILLVIGLIVFPSWFENHSNIVYSQVSNTTEKFDFPKVKPDPNPLQLLGPAGEKFTFIKTGETTGGRYSMALAEIPAKTGPLPHVHRMTDEWFYIQEGSLQMHMGSSTYTAGMIPGTNAPKDRLHTINATPKSLLYGPRYYIHGFKNVTNKPVKMIFVWTPDTGITDYFKTVAQPVQDFKNPPALNPKNKALFVTEAPKFGINQSSYFEEYIEAVDNNFPKMEDNQSARLVELLTTNALPLPKSYSASKDVISEKNDAEESTHRDQ